MARPPTNREFLILWQAMRRRRVKSLIMLYFLMLMLMIFIRRRRRSIFREPSWFDPIIRSTHLSNMIDRNDTLCIEQLRMDRRCFRVVCSLVRDIGGLKDTKNMSVEEMVAIFLHIIGYDEKNREMKFYYHRSQETISRQFHNVLRAILKLWRVLLKTPQPISDDCTYKRWKWFKNCIGALDGTYIKVNVRTVDKPRYRSRNRDIATNVLGVCGPDMQFSYVLAGWEGSAADGRVLRDALSRPNGLKVPRGCYYLVDAGYKNCEGFLAPYRGQRYHLQEWSNPPTKKEELFNMKHASARNVIERTFGLLKIRWSILRNPSYYSIQTHTDIILACCYLHSLIRQQMSYEPLKRSWMNICEPIDQISITLMLQKHLPIGLDGETN
ncbi:protein ALP1-like isoform X2 [Spinacia oleracea]|nr:protein ALP1-like isoform X2 [Spinacia oleracea]